MRVYLAKEDTAYSEAYAKLELPASPWEVWDAMNRARIKDGESLHMEIDDYYAFEYLIPHLEELDISLNELNDLAEKLATLDEIQAIAFDGMLSMEVRKKINTNSGVITLQDLRNLAVSAKTDCYHVVDAADEAALGRFYAENEFIPELDEVPDAVFNMLDFASIGRMMSQCEGGVFTGGCYVVRDGKMTAAPPCSKELPKKPDYLFRLTLGLHPDLEDARTVTLELPATHEELLAAQEQLDTDGWNGVMLTDYDGIIPYAAEFAELPSELERFNEFAKTVRDISEQEVQVLKLKALLEHFEVKDMGTAISLTEHMEDYVLTPAISSPPENAIGWLNALAGDRSVELLLPHVDLYRLGSAIIQEDNAALTPYGLLNRTDYEPMLSPIQSKQETEMTM